MIRRSVRALRLGPPGLVVACFGAALFAAVFAVGNDQLPMSGGITGGVVAIGFAAIPVLAYVAIKNPLALPFALWAGLVPLENILAVKGASLEKFLGLATAGAAVIHVLARRRVARLPAAVYAWLIFLAYAGASLAWAQPSDASVPLLVMFASTLLAVVAVALVPPSEEDLRWICGAIVIGGLVTAAFAAVGASHFQQKGIDPRIELSNGTVTTDPNFSAATLLMPAIVSAVCAIAVRSVPIRIACAAGAMACTFGIAVFASRGGLIALAGGIAYVFLRARQRLVMLPVGALALSTIFAFPSVLARFTNPHLRDGSGRYDIWHVGFAAFKAHWAFGNGFGTFGEAYRQAILDTYVPLDQLRQTQSHNCLLQFAVELGIAGVAIALVAGYLQLTSLRTIPPSAGGWFSARVACEASAVAVVIDSFTINLLAWKFTWLCFAMMWMLRAAYVRRVAERGEPAGAPARVELDAPRVALPAPLRT